MGLSSHRAPASVPDPFALRSAEATFLVPRIPEPAPLQSMPTAQLGCREVDSHGDSRHSLCETTTDSGPARMNLLVLQGGFPQAAYEHGYLMAREIETGSLSEALSNIKKMDEELPKSIVGIAHRVFACYQNKIERGSDEEFRTAVRELHRGYSDRMLKEGRPVAYSAADIAQATYSIEVGNVFYSLMYQASQNPAVAVGHLLRDCGLSVTGAALKEMYDRLFKREIARNKLACSGAVVPKTVSADGFLYHARNLEQTSMIESWNRNPVTILAAEPGHYKYVAFGTAGLIFPGGISGYNEKGISVSTHQMDPATYRVNWKKGSAAMGPYVQQRILREAASLEDAVRIAQSVRHFSAWSILVSDAKTHRAISIELTRDGAVVGNESSFAGLAQSNHYNTADNQKNIFFDSYNFYLETVARYQWIDHVLKANAMAGSSQHGSMSLAGLLDLLASHVDYFTGEVSYGRSVARVMNILSSVVSPEQNKVWVTLSDRMPSNHGYYLGLDVDFASMRLTPNGAIRITTQDGVPGYKETLSLYQSAYRAKVAGDLLTARERLEKAHAAGLRDGRDDLNIRLLIAHFLLQEEKWAEAYEHLKLLEPRILEFHPLQRASLRMYRIWALDHLSEGHPDRTRDLALRDQWYRSARSVYAYALLGQGDSKYFPLAAGGVLQTAEDLKHRAKLLERIYEHHRKAKIPSVDMKTAE